MKRVFAAQSLRAAAENFRLRFDSIHYLWQRTLHHPAREINERCLTVTFCVTEGVLTGMEEKKKGKASVRCVHHLSSLTFKVGRGRGRRGGSNYAT